jgi:predicted transcriptional regulator
LEVKQHHITKAGQLISYYIKSARNLFIELKEIGDIKSVAGAMNNKTNREKCIELKNKGFNNTQIADTIGVSKARVGQILKK